MDAAFSPALGGFRLEMPGGAHFVWAIDTEVQKIMLFDPMSVDCAL
jgi:hypothetical protein